MTTKALAYLRISTQEQIQGHGLEAQKMAIEAYCQQHNIEILGFYTDIASGTRKNRTGMTQLLADLATSEADAIVTAHTDRISRQLSSLLSILEIVGKLNKRIISVHQPELRTDSAHGKLLCSILGAIAEFELHAITSRLYGGRMVVRKQFEDGVSNRNWGRRPRLHERKNWTIEPDGSITKTIVEDESMKPVVDLIRRHRRSGKSFFAITKYMNEKGIPNKTGRPWNHVSVKRLCTGLFR
ncbi:MAG TPA: recombinase family protein [Coleofasciculaceae cyanobacterium]|jgi:DNA invertase Pin-like site-specific DNA recombinase